MARHSRRGEAMQARRHDSGFTYLGLMAAIVILGILLTMAGRVWSFSEQRDKEAQLLWVGDQYREAIARYYAVGHQYPLALELLLTDDRFPVPRRHLRQLYRDPVTGAADWDLIMDANGGGIMGVASKSNLAPIKRSNFADIDYGFADKDCYCDWKFLYIPRNNFYHRYGAPGQAPAPMAPTLPPGCDPSSTQCTPPRTLPPNTSPPNTPFPGRPPRTH